MIRAAPEDWTRAVGSEEAQSDNLPSPSTYTDGDQVGTEVPQPYFNGEVEVSLWEQNGQWLFLIYYASPSITDPIDSRTTAFNLDRL